MQGTGFQRSPQQYLDEKKQVTRMFPSASAPTPLSCFGLQRPPCPPEIVYVV